MNIIQQSRESWDRLSEFRRKRNRCRDYTFGRQWSDTIEVNGRRLTEYEYILREGNVPLKNNLIRRIVRNVLGVFRERLGDIMKETYGDNLSETAEKNCMEEIFCRTFLLCLLASAAVREFTFVIK